MNKKKAKKWFVFSCLAPAVTLVLLFIVYPTIEVFRTAFYRKATFVSEAEFAGFFNYEVLFKDMKFIESMQNAILYVVLITMITMVLAVVFAAILTREDIKFKNFFRVIFYIPNILSIVVVAGIFQAMYNPTNGILNSFFDMIGLGFLHSQWMGNPDIINYCVIAALIWQAIGYYMVMYMAGMSSIPESLYEAASLEGASKIQQFYMITLPLVWNNIRTTLTFFVISTINLSFMFIQLTSNGDLGSESALNYMYNNAFAGKYGYGMAIGSVIFIFSFILAGILNKITEREVLEY
ncbi:MAG: sugar ABC transporter permease [Erysipelotrichaceae bacterium]|nr:sugar ABC transporter permease [Erysipelotrichaceae bacterium]MDY5251607.1 sugar ABC transporter permease [Erysipelotrichaceae bacterium]